jgi:hypothetical protein
MENDPEDDCKQAMQMNASSFPLQLRISFLQTVAQEHKFCRGSQNPLVFLKDFREPIGDVHVLPPLENHLQNTTNDWTKCLWGTSIVGKPFT